MLPPGGGFLDTTVEPETLPAWLSAEGVAYDANEFRASGFTAPLSWYRSMRRTTDLMAPWRGAPIRQPSMFIAGSRDGVMSFPSSKTALERFATALPGLRGSHLIEGAGHWIQRERADEVNALSTAFLAGL